MRRTFEANDYQESTGLENADGVLESNPSLVSLSLKDGSMRRSSRRESGIICVKYYRARYLLKSLLLLMVGVDTTNWWMWVMTKTFG